MRQQIDKIKTEHGNLGVSLACQEDYEVVRHMLIEAANWMSKHGVKQWYPDQFTSEEVKSYFEYRDIYIIEDRGELVGMFTLQDADPDYWGDLSVPGYSYLHRLTVRLPFRGKHLGSEMIRWAGKHSKQLGQTGLRLDCWSQNVKLNALYQSLGFERKGTGQKNGRDYNLYELSQEVFESL